MSGVNGRLEALGLRLPPDPVVPPGVELPFAWVRVHGPRVLVSGHGALGEDGKPLGPFGRVPGQVPLAAAQSSAASAVRTLVASLRRDVGDLDRLEWLSLQCFVNADPGYPWTTLVANAASELILDLFGRDRGSHARTAPGVSALPFDLPVILAGELVLLD